MNVSSYIVTCTLHGGGRHGDYPCRTHLAFAKSHIGTRKSWECILWPDETNASFWTNLIPSKMYDITREEKDEMCLVQRHVNLIYFPCMKAAEGVGNCTSSTTS